MKISIARLKQIIKEETEAIALEEVDEPTDVKKLGRRDLRKWINKLGPKDLKGYGKNRRGTDQISYETWIKARRALAKGQGAEELAQIVKAEAPTAVDALQIAGQGIKAADKAAVAAGGGKASFEDLKSSLQSAMASKLSTPQAKNRINRIKRMIARKPGGKEYLATLQGLERKPDEPSAFADRGTSSDDPPAKDKKAAAGQQGGGEKTTTTFGVDDKGRKTRTTTSLSQGAFDYGKLSTAEKTVFDRAVKNHISALIKIGRDRNLSMTRAKSAATEKWIRSGGDMKKFDQSMKELEKDVYRRHSRRQASRR